MWTNMADDVPLAFYHPGGLFLKADSRIFIEVKLPEIRASGASVSNWEVMEKLKALSKPEEFQTLRVARYSRERIEFEGEFESLRPMRKLVLLLNGKSMKLSGYTELLKIKAKQLEPPFPTKSEWEDYFTERGVQTFEEAKPGERPDTLRIKGLPVRWFVSKTSEGRPCPRVLTQAFQKFGKVRQVGIYDPSSFSSSLTAHSQDGTFSSFGPGSGTRALHFEAYVQYDKYVSFCTAMSSLRGMQILRLEEGGREALARISVDFDKSAFLSDRNVRKRRHAEERRQKELEEAESERERERKAQQCKEQEALRALEEEKALKRARRREERQRRKQEQVAMAAKLKSIAVRRREEAQRLLSVLLAGAAEAKYQEEERERREALAQQRREEEELKRREQIEEEAILKEELVKKVHELEHRKREIQRELLLRTLDSSSGHPQLRSAVVVPHSGNPDVH